MDRYIKTTADGSNTLYVPQWDEHYHSIHGAMQESRHVFVRNGLQAYTDTTAKKCIKILEIGMGTGLNVLLSIDFVEKNNASVYYEAIEYYPLLLDEYQLLNYSNINYYFTVHEAPFEQNIRIAKNFILHKKKIKIEEYRGLKDTFDIVYFDAFAPSAQPELWTEAIFSVMYACMCEGGILVTYCAKGEVKRRLRSVGFTVEVLPGPPGKREMTRAIKPKYV